MFKRMILGAFAFAVLLQTAHARRIAVRAPTIERVKQVQGVAVGRVIGLLNRDLVVQGVTYRVAIVRVGERFKGLKKNTTIRIGFTPQPNQPNQPRILIGGRPRVVRSVSLTVGDHGLFFLNKHAKADFYLAPTAYDFVSSSTPGYAAKVVETKMMLKIGDNPKKALKSKDANERFVAAALLIQKYRTTTGRRPPLKLTPISADESKLILKGLLDGDWNQPRSVYNQLHPWNMFNRLGLSTNDGWRPPPGARRIEDYYTAAQVWLSANAGKYRIKKYMGK